MQRIDRVLVSAFASTLLFAQLAGPANAAGHFSDPDWKPLPKASGRGQTAVRSPIDAVPGRSSVQGHTGFASAASAATGLAGAPNGSSRAGLPVSPFAWSRTYWNTALPADAPIDPNSASFISFLKSDNTLDYVKISGTTSDGKWGTPVYRARKRDKAYVIVNSCSSYQPPEFGSVRIPGGAHNRRRSRRGRRRRSWKFRQPHRRARLRPRRGRKAHGQHGQSREATQHGIVGLHACPPLSAPVPSNFSRCVGPEMCDVSRSVPASKLRRQEKLLQNGAFVLRSGAS